MPEVPYLLTLLTANLIFFAFADQAVIGQDASFPQANQSLFEQPTDLSSDLAPFPVSNDQAGDYLGVRPTSSDAWIRTNTALSTRMLDFQNRQSGKERLLLLAAAPGGQPIVTIGGQGRASLFAAATNRDNKFNYMGRFPGDFRGSSASDARLLHGNASVAVQLGQFTHLYGETLFSDVFSFADFKQGSFQVRQAFVVFGDACQTPWYAYIGKKNVSFGDMSTLSPFSQSMVWHYFAALHEGVGVGYASGQWDWSVAALNGGRGIRVADSESIGKLNNLAANMVWTGETSGGSLRFGAGFLLGTIYDAARAEHLDPTAFGDYNPAWDVNVQWQRGPWTLAAEYATTVNQWPTTGHAVTAYRTEAAYQLPTFSWPTRLSVSWSEGIQGPAGSEFEFNRQLVLGLGTQVNPNVLLTLEFVRGAGFAPLINITRVSDREVVQNSIVAGAVLVF